VSDDINVDGVRDEADYLAFRPGQRLRKAREVRGLTVDEVAKELHLSVRFVNLMEADSYKELPEPAFVRGYMRRYAQLLKLSADDIAGRFDQCYAADTETPEPDARPYNPVQLLGIITKPRLRLRRVLSWASFALIAALGAGFLWSGINSRQAVVPAEAVSPVSVPAESVVAAAPAAPLALPAASAVGGSGMSLLPSPATASSVAALAPVAPVSASAAAGPDTLELVLTAPSWISVQDASRQSLLSAVRPAGSITLKGEAPFSVNVGDASVVTMVFNGKAVDLKPHTRGAVATLTLKR